MGVLLCGANRCGEGVSGAYKLMRAQPGRLSEKFTVVCGPKDRLGAKSLNLREGRADGAILASMGSAMLRVSCA